MIVPFDFSSKYSQPTRDYAIVSQFSDPTTGQPVVIAAELGENGTIAAGEFLTSSREMQSVAERAPPIGAARILKSCSSHRLSTKDRARPYLIGSNETGR
jgi:hypothetical protein